MQQANTEEKRYISFTVSDELTAAASVSTVPPVEAATNE
jgi:hypothetical protein